jgi:hypothetical protein
MLGAEEVRRFSRPTADIEAVSAPIREGSEVTR